MTLAQLGLSFLRIGATGFGGPMSLIGLMEQHVVRKTDELSEEDLAQGIAIGQILPGPVALGCAAHLGYRLRGFLGALVSVSAMILPPFVLMLALTPLYLRYGRVPEAAAFFRGVAPAVIAVILSAAWRLSAKCVQTWTAGLIAAAAFASLVLKAPPVLVVLATGIAGVIVQAPWRRPPPKPGGAAGEGGAPK